MLKDNIKIMIENDIERCKEGEKQIKGSYDLYLELCAKYSRLDKTFDDGIKSMGKVATSDGWDYRRELKQIKEILNMYLELDEIPIQYTENVAEGVNVNIKAKKFTNKGNIGKGNSQSTNKETKISTSIKVGKEEKESFWKSLWRKLFHKKEQD